MPVIVVRILILGVAALALCAYLHSVKPQDLGKPVCKHWVLEAVDVTDSVVSHCTEWSN
jgi:hypothetical protein